jgi:hypothetical protein
MAAGRSLKSAAKSELRGTVRRSPYGCGIKSLDPMCWPTYDHDTGISGDGTLTAKKKPGTEVPGKLNREASRLGDVGSKGSAE